MVPSLTCGSVDMIGNVGSRRMHNADVGVQPHVVLHQTVIKANAARVDAEVVDDDVEFVVEDLGRDTVGVRVPFVRVVQVSATSTARLRRRASSTTTARVRVVVQSLNLYVASHSSRSATENCRCCS